jgi:hypothetical protein
MCIFGGVRPPAEDPSEAKAQREEDTAKAEAESKVYKTRGS